MKIRKGKTLLNLKVQTGHTLKLTLGLIFFHCVYSVLVF